MDKPRRFSGTHITSGDGVGIHRCGWIGEGCPLLGAQAAKAILGQAVVRGREQDTERFGGLCRGRPARLGGRAQTVTKASRAP